MHEFAAFFVRNTTLISPLVWPVPVALRSEITVEIFSYFGSSSPNTAPVRAAALLRTLTVGGGTLCHVPSPRNGTEGNRGTCPEAQRVTMFDTHNPWREESLFRMFASWVERFHVECSATKRSNCPCTASEIRNGGVVWWCVCVWKRNWKQLWFCGGSRFCVNTRNGINDVVLIYKEHHIILYIVVWVWTFAPYRTCCC